MSDPRDDVRRHVAAAEDALSRSAHVDARESFAAAADAALRVVGEAGSADFESAVVDAASLRLKAGERRQAAAFASVWVSSDILSAEARDSLRAVLRAAGDVR